MEVRPAVGWDKNRGSVAANHGHRCCQTKGSMGKEDRDGSQGQGSPRGLGSRSQWMAVQGAIP